MQRASPKGFDAHTRHAGLAEFCQFVPEVDFGHQQPGLRALDDGVDFPRPDQRRRRHSDSPNTQQRQEGGDEVGTIQQPKDHAIAGLDSPFAEGSRKLHHLVVQLRIRNDGFAEMNGGRRITSMLEVFVEQLVTGVQRIRIGKFRQCVNLLRPEFVWWIGQHDRWEVTTKSTRGTKILVPCASCGSVRLFVTWERSSCAGSPTIISCRHKPHCSAASAARGARPTRERRRQYSPAPLDGPPPDPATSKSCVRRFSPLPLSFVRWTPATRLRFFSRPLPLRPLCFARALKHPDREPSPPGLPASAH